MYANDLFIISIANCDNQIGYVYNYYIIVVLPQTFLISGITLGIHYVYIY